MVQKELYKRANAYNGGFVQTLSSGNSSTSSRKGNGTRLQLFREIEKSRNHSEILEVAEKELIINVKCRNSSEHKTHTILHSTLKTSTLLLELNVLLIRQ